MNHSEKKILIIGGSILGGLILMFALYKKLKKPNYSFSKFQHKQTNNIPDDEDDEAGLARTAKDMMKATGGKNKKSRKLRKRHTKSK